MWRTEPTDGAAHPFSAPERRFAAAAKQTAALDILVAEDNEVNQFVFSQVLDGIGQASASPATAARQWKCTACSSPGSSSWMSRCPK